MHEKPVGERLLEKATDKPKRVNTGATQYTNCKAEHKDPDQQWLESKRIEMRPHNKSV